MQLRITICIITAYRINQSFLSVPPTGIDPPLVLSLSSGTTGVPKGPMISHGQMLARFMIYFVTLGFDQRTRYLSASPLYFGGSRGYAMCAPRMSSQTKASERFDLSRWRVAGNGADMIRPDVMQAFVDAFADAGLDPSRLILEGASTPEEMMARYNNIDIALDTFPYNGGLTTCEALWMGVPVITLVGDIFAGRHSLSHLSTVGLSELAAPDEAGYRDLAVALANDIPRLAAMRAGLRERMGQSPLCDGPRFAKNFAAAMRDVWRQWCLLENA